MNYLKLMMRSDVIKSTKKPSYKPIKAGVSPTEKEKMTPLGTPYKEVDTC